VTLDRSTVSGNSAAGGDGGGSGEGGGLANDYGSVYFDNGTVSGNVSSGSAGTVGGGIFNDSGSVALTYSHHCFQRCFRRLPAGRRRAFQLLGFGGTQKHNRRRERRDG